MGDQKSMKNGITPRNSNMRLGMAARPSGEGGEGGGLILG